MTALGQTDLVAFLDRSPCPFAQRARTVVPQPWPDPRPTARRLDRLADALGALGESPESDLVALEIRDRGPRLKSARVCGALLNAVLRGLHRRDPCGKGAFPGPVDEDPDWDFRFRRESFFVSVFAGCYPAGHSRFSGDPALAFVLFQPESSFRRFGVSSARGNRAGLSAKVRDRFRRHGFEYDLDAYHQMPKALRYVKPGDPGEGPVRWWELARSDGFEGI